MSRSDIMDFILIALIIERIYTYIRRREKPNFF